MNARQEIMVFMMFTVLFLLSPEPKELFTKLLVSLLAICIVLGHIFGRKMDAIDAAESAKEKKGTPN